VAGDVFWTPGHAVSGCPAELCPVRACAVYTDGLGRVERLQNFMAVFDYVVEDLKKTDSMIMEPEMVAWVEKTFRYNVPHGKLNRGLAVVAACKILQPERMKTDQQMYFAACVLGWGIEWLQAFFLVADDIMDHSITRRGQPCWYKIPEVGLMAVNDCCILEGTIYRLLKRYLRHLPNYDCLVDLFHEVTYATTMGQNLDMLTAPDGVDNFDAYNMARYCQIVKFKTAFYTFYLPTACALQLCGVTAERHYLSARNICLMIGEFFQIQDDYLDCYGAPEVIGKIGTDIQDNKCSWLVCQAKSLATPSQLKTLRANYGKNDKQKVARVKALYLDMQMEAVYQAYEAAAYAAIVQAVKMEVGASLQPIYSWYLSKIFRRDK